MLMFGTNLLSAADRLQGIDEKSVYVHLTNPDEDMVTKVQQLRAIYQIDKKKYAEMKRLLPYIVCGWFELPYRRLDNFASIDHFILDIDHLSEKGLDITDVREMLKKDSRIVMMFTSPGNDGLKLLFKLKDKCYDPEIYKLFYKVFAYQFSLDYKFEQAIDSRTCDVTRACFLSIDSDAYYNENATAIDINNYLDDANVQSLYDLKHDMDKMENTLQPIEQQAECLVDPDEEALNFIRQQLSSKKKTIVERLVFVPEILQKMIADIANSIQETGIIVTEITDIQYGKKIKVVLGSKMGEVNVYYGRNGFTVIESPKRGTSEELNSVTADIITAYVNEPVTTQRIACMN